VDAKGAQSRVKFFISVDTLAGAEAVLTAYVDALSAVTNAAQMSIPGLGGVLTTSGEYGTAAEYDSVTDVAILEAIDSAGSIHRFSIPAPKAAIFQADKIAVDFTNTDVATLVDVIVNGAEGTSFISTRSGLQFSSVPTGARVKKRNRRRYSGFTKASNLTAKAQ
jgi:hypothetical protein